MFIQNKEVNILGTVYTVMTRKVSEDDYMLHNNVCGYCDDEMKVIVVADTTEKKYFRFKNGMEYYNRSLRHEIIHAFLNESGLMDSALQPCNAWSKNEEMIDWFAIQLPKINKVFKELNIIEPAKAK